MGFSLHVENFRILQAVDWSPEGVCALVGPNGAGKSTLLQAVEFLHNTLMRGPRAAAELAGGAAMLRHFHARPNEEIVLEFRYGDTRWQIRAHLAGVGLQTPITERLWAGSKVLLEQEAGNPQFRAVEQQFDTMEGFSAIGSAVRSGIQVGDRFDLGPLISYGYFYSPALLQLRSVGCRNGSDVVLDGTGSNLFTVLRNWQAGERKHRERLSFVKEGLVEAFPGGFEDLDFEAAGQTVTARFYMPKLKQPIPIYLAPNGLLAAMIHLAAVASAEAGGTVAIDEMENSLHPHAIRVLIEHMRARATQKDLTIILATHSPVVLDQFKNEPSHVFVIEAGKSPMPLDQLENPEWLGQFSIGSLYANEDIGAPRPLDA